jgi:Na+-transporting methylmalonyl-CoA/oxaloacetate decarboxylase gamma subunit
MTEEVMKVEVVSLPSLPESPLTDTTSDHLELASLDISIEKLALVLGITFAFILLLLFSLICIFYVMGFLQNVFGYSWAGPIGRIENPQFYPEECLTADDITTHHPQSRCTSSLSHHRGHMSCAHGSYGGLGTVQTF